eukprot:scaffold4845_cov159-Ochromonas_danica.AAC.15
MAGRGTLSSSILAITIGELNADQLLPKTYSLYPNPNPSNMHSEDLLHVQTTMQSGAFTRAIEGKRERSFKGVAPLNIFSEDD